MLDHKYGHIHMRSGLEIMFPKFQIMVIGSHDFPCFFQVGNPAFPPIIINFLPIVDRLLFRALVIETSNQAFLLLQYDNSSSHIWKNLCAGGGVHLITSPIWAFHNYHIFNKIWMLACMWRSPLWHVCWSSVTHKCCALLPAMAWLSN